VNTSAFSCGAGRELQVWGPPDECSDHRSACPTAGFLRARALPLERAVAVATPDASHQPQIHVDL